MENKRWLPVVFLLFACAVSADGAELSSDAGQSGPAPPVRPAPPAANPIADLVRRCVVLPGHHYKGLTVFPVQASDPLLPMNPLTLDEATAMRAIIVTEKGLGQVPVLVVENRSAQFIFIMAGEILVGGKQNRIFRADVLLPPHSGPIELAAYCVEQGRWAAPSAPFASGGNLAAPQVRFEAQKSADQRVIWEGVAETSRTLGQASATQDYNYLYEQRDVSKQVAEYRDALCRALPRHVIGIVVARDSDIIGADLFGNASLFLKLRNKVLDSYAIGSLNRFSKMPPPDPVAAQQFLFRVLAARYWAEPSPGAGVTGRAVGNGVDARALIFSERPLHVSIFPAVTILPLPVLR